MKTILVLAANPIDTSRLRLDKEVREIELGLQRAKRRDEFTLVQKWAPRSIDVRRAMLYEKPNIVHFCGHGEGAEGLVFEDNAGKSNLVAAEVIADFFKLFADKLECVVLNACYSEVQADAIAQHINYVIGMKNNIKDAAAIEFAVAFYDAITTGKSIEFAYKLACNAIQWTDMGEDLEPILKAKTLGKHTISLYSHIASLAIMVTGGLEPSDDVLKVAFNVGQQVVLRGHCLISSGSRGVDTLSGEGALKSCHSLCVEPHSRIQVYRPCKNPKTALKFDNLHIVGSSYAESRDFAIQKSDAVILLEGGRGTQDVARQAQIMRKPVVPIGVGRSETAAVISWHKMHRKDEYYWPVVQISDEDLQKIGPEQTDLQQVASSAVDIVEKLVQRELLRS